MMKEFLVKFGSRKLLVFLASCGLLAYKLISEEIWLAVAIAYMGANVFEAVKGVVSGKASAAKKALDEADKEEAK